MSLHSKFCYWICFSFLAATVNTSFAQDQHFSQFFAAPLNLNPALAGSFNGSFRIGAIYRDQWRVALENPISTYGIGGDIKYPLTFTNKKNPDFAAIGFQFFGDKAALYDLSTNQLSVFGAYHKALDKRTKQFLSAGFQLGIAQKNINYEDLIFADQFNNLDAYSLESSENLPVNNFAYGDFGLGLHYTISPSKFFNFNTGYSLVHFHTPNISFYKNDDAINPNLEKENILYSKSSFYINSEFKITDVFSISPRVLFMTQGPHQELNVGSSFRFGNTQATQKALHLGAFLRPVRDFDKYALDALVLLTGYEYNSLLIGMSYDLNLRDLVSDQKGIGIFELSITYIGDYENDFNFCPKF